MQELINDVLRNYDLPIPTEQLVPIFTEHLEKDGDFTRAEMNQVAGLAEDSELVATTALQLRDDHFSKAGKRAPKWPELPHEA